MKTQSHSVDPHDQHNHIDSLLRHDAANWRDEYIDNADFSLQVMASVVQYPRQPFMSAKKRRLIISLTTAMATIAVILFGAGGNFLIDAVMDIATQTITPTVIGLVVIVISMIAGGLALALDDPKYDYKQR
jgi:ABC-type antimicrobial peptide transport system permease subunit